MVKSKGRVTQIPRTHGELKLTLADSEVAFGNFNSSRKWVLKASGQLLDHHGGIHGTAAMKKGLSNL